MAIILFLIIGMLLGAVHILISKAKVGPICPPDELKDIIYNIKPEAYPYRGNK